MPKLIITAVLAFLSAFALVFSAPVRGTALYVAPHVIDRPSIQFPGFAIPQPPKFREC